MILKHLRYHPLLFFAYCKQTHTIMIPHFLLLGKSFFEICQNNFRIFLIFGQQVDPLHFRKNTVEYLLPNSLDKHTFFWYNS